MIPIYTHIAFSPSDPYPANPLGFVSVDAALNHADTMNKALELYDNSNTKWNKEYWKTKPLPWIVKELDTPKQAWME